MTIPTVTLAGKQVGKVGLGLMQLTWTPTPPPEEQAFAAIKAAVDAGATTWSSATFYGNPGHEFDNIAMLGRFFKTYPEYIGKVQLVIKGGVAPLNGALTPTNDINVNRDLLNKTKDLLGPVPIDVYLPARILPGQDPVAYMAPFEELRKEGHFGALGASEVSAKTLCALSAAYNIAVAEIEVSLWSYEQEIQDVIAWSTQTKVPVYAYSPLGRGFITRTWKTPEDVPQGSFQSHSPRFQGDAFYHNLTLVDKLDEIAAKKGLTTAQMAIAWVCATGPYVIPIPGSSNPERARQNVEAANIKLDAEDLKTINDVLAKFDLAGGRYPESHSAALMV